MNRSQPPKDSLFQPRRHPGQRVLLTGQVGLDKKEVVDELARLADEGGRHVDVFHVGDMMYAEAPDVVPGRILDLPRQRLEQLRRSVFKDILAAAPHSPNMVINTHATFRWRHGLFHAYDHSDMVKLDADLYITLIDNAHAVHERLLREHDIHHTLKDIMVWREEEILATRAMAEAVRGYGHAFIVSRTDSKTTAETILSLMFQPNRKRVYPSFPMTHVMGMPDVLAEIDRFRARLAEYFITFDPGDVDEKDLLFQAGAAIQKGRDEFTIPVNGRQITLKAADVTHIARDIDGQIYARDFMLIDQSDMIITYIPVMPDGRPGLSSGVERELQHAFETTKEVYVVWTPKNEPSPFVTATATRIYSNLDQLFEEFQTKGYIDMYQHDLPVAAPKSTG